MRKYYPFLLALFLFIQPSGGGSAALQQEGEESMQQSKAEKPLKEKGKILPLEAEIHKLPSGLTVTLVPFDSPGLAAYYTAMRVGSRDETDAGHSGFAHLFEHMMFRGTKNLPGSVYDNTVTAMGADSSAWTWNDQTVYFFVASSDKIGKVIEMEAERFINLYYEETDFKTESGAVLGEYNKNYSNPINKLDEVLFDKAFKKHTYKHTTMGFIDDIRAMPAMYDYSLKFFKRHYVPGNALIFVVGDFNSGDVLEKIEKHYGDWSGELRETVTPLEPPQVKEIRTHLSWNNPVLPMMLMGYKAPAYSTRDKESAALFLAGEMLFGEAGPLFKRLVLDEQVVEDLEYWDWKQRDPGLFIVKAILKKDDDFDLVISAIDREIDVLAGGDFDKQRLENTRSHYRYSILLSLNTPRSVAHELAFYATLDGDSMGLDKFLQKIDEVTVQDIVHAAENYLVPVQRTIATLSYRQQKESMDKAKKGGGK